MASWQSFKNDFENERHKLDEASRIAAEQNEKAKKEKKNIMRKKRDTFFVDMRRHLLRNIFYGKKLKSSLIMAGIIGTPFLVFGGLYAAVAPALIAGVATLGAKTFIFNPKTLNGMTLYNVLRGGQVEHEKDIAQRKLNKRTNNLVNNQGITQSHVSQNVSQSQTSQATPQSHASQSQTSQAAPQSRVSQSQTSQTTPRNQVSNSQFGAVKYTQDDIDEEKKGKLFEDVLKSKIVDVDDVRFRYPFMSFNDVLVDLQKRGFILDDYVKQNENDSSHHR